MNAPIIRLFGLVVVLFAVLVAFTSRWAVFDSKSLNDNALNKRGVLEAAKIKRGVIRAGDGSVLARSVKQQGGVYERTWPASSASTTSRWSASARASTRCSTSSAAGARRATTSR